MVFGNLSTGIQIFEGSQDGQGNWLPDLKYTLVDTAEGKSLTDYYAYGLYKVEFEDEAGDFGEPEWRIYSEGSQDLLDDDGNDKFEGLTYTFGQDSPTVTLQKAGADDFESRAPYMATYTTEEDGKEALANSVPKMGCRDSAASNYDYKATMDDGTCTSNEGSKNEGSNMLMYVLAAVGIGAVVLM